MRDIHPRTGLFFIFLHSISFTVLVNIRSRCPSFPSTSVKEGGGRGVCFIIYFSAVSLFSWFYDSEQLNKDVLQKLLQQVAFRKSPQSLFPFECSHKETKIQYVRSYENLLSLTSDFLFFTSISRICPLFSVKFTKCPGFVKNKFLF